MIAEVIGLAGAGKSSLRRALLQEGISTFTRGLAIRKPQNWPYFVGSGIRVAPRYWDHLGADAGMTGRRWRASSI
ncbi:MAG: hypothetical protein R2911_02700 [Caldilineaceae bacterium]